MRTGEFLWLLRRSESSECRERRSSVASKGQRAGAQLVAAASLAGRCPCEPFDFRPRLHTMDSHRASLARSGLSSALLMVIAASLFGYLPKLSDSVQLASVITALVCLAVTLRSAGPLRASGLTTGTLLMVTATILPVLVFATLAAEGHRTVLVGGAGPTLLGWAVALWLFAETHRAEQASVRQWTLPRVAVPILLTAVFVLLAVVHQLAVGRWAVQSDEVIYLLQSAWFGAPDYGWRVSPDLVPHLLMRKLGVTPGGSLYGMYPPGWPAVLALFDAVGLRWWSGVVLGTCSVYGTFRLGSLLYSRESGFLAAVLLAVNPWFLVLHAGYMAHALTIACVLFAAVWLVESETCRGWPRGWRWIAVGAILALVGTTRPLTGVTLAASLGVWMIVRRRLTWPELAACAAASLIGVLPIAAWFLHYNLVTNGVATRLSYQALHGDGYNLGFGTRGFTGFDESMQRVRAAVVEFTVRDAVEHFARRLSSVNLSFVPYSLLAPLVLFAHRAKHRIQWKAVAVFLVLPVAYFFYWGDDTRFYSELLPFVLAWSAAALLAVRRARPPFGMALIIAVVTGSVMLNVPGRWERLALDGPWQRSAYTENPARFALFEQLDSLQREKGSLLVIVRERSPLLDVLLDRVYQFNVRREGADVLVVRDRGLANDKVMARFPERTVVMVSDSGRVTPAGVRVLPTP